MKRLISCTLMMMILFVGVLAAQTPQSTKKALDLYRSFIPKQANGSMAKSTVLTEYENQSYYGDWEGDRKVLITYDNQARIRSLLTGSWDTWSEVWTEDRRETLSYLPDGNPQQMIVEYWDGGQWFPATQIDFFWDVDRLASIQHQMIEGAELFPLMSQTYHYNEDDNRLEFVDTIMSWDISSDIYMRVHLDWDAMGRVQTATMQFGDGIDWVDAYKTVISYHPSDQSDYQTYMDFLISQVTFGEHELNHLASQIKVQEELDYFMNEDTLEWDTEGKYEYSYDANLRLLQTNYYMAPMEWDSKEDWELVSREDFTYDAAGNMTEWLISDVFFTEIEPSSRTLYTYSEVTSNPDGATPLRPTSLSVFPNPFNPNTTIAFDLPKAEKVEIAVFNLKGQKVRTLLNDNKSAGKHQVNWDGKDDSGHPLSSGIYFLKLNAGQETNTKKLILQK